MARVGLKPLSGRVIPAVNIEKWTKRRLGPFLQISVVCTDGREQEVLLTRTIAEAGAAVVWIKGQMASAVAETADKVLVDAREALQIARRVL